MKHLDLLKKIIVNSSLKIKKLAGSSESSVFLVNDNTVYKIGPKNNYFEGEKYHLFSTYLKNNYEEIFPAINLVFEKNDLCIWKMKYLGENFEDYILSAGCKKNIFIFNTLVLKKINFIYEKTKILKDKKKNNQQFFDEIISAIECNLEKSNMINIFQEKLNRIKKSSKKITINNIPSIVHKDLSVGNIIISSNDIFFIDPRSIIPHSKVEAPVGNIAIDLVGYYVSMLRKNMELKNDAKSKNIYPVINTIEDEVKYYEDHKIFSVAFKDLCFMVWYSIYLSCRCDYCLSVDRVWLYEKMKEGFSFHLNKLFNFCQNKEE